MAKWTLPEVRKPLTAEDMAALQARAEAAEAKVKALVDALEFYRDGFVQKTNRTKTGLVVSVDYAPTETLLDDCGNKAIEAIAAIQEDRG